MTATKDSQILAFCCKYCSYAAADLAGSMRLNYPPNVKVIQVPCTGRVDVIHLSGLKAVPTAFTWRGDWTANAISWKEIEEREKKSTW